MYLQQYFRGLVMWTACKQCENCLIPDCVTECAPCRNPRSKKRCRKRGKCSQPKWVGSSPAPSSSPATLPQTASNSVQSAAATVSPCGDTPPPPSVASSLSNLANVSTLANASTLFPFLTRLGQGTSSSTPPPILASAPDSQLSNVATSPSPPSQLNINSTPSTSVSRVRKSHKRGAGRSKASDEAAPQRRKKTLQEEHENNLRTEKDFVEVLKDDRGLAKKMYRCRKCNLVKKCRVNCIRHASTCGGKTKKVYRRGKSKKLLPCNLCTHQETTRQGLMKHRQRAHKDMMRRPRCWKCNLFFSSTKSYRLASVYGHSMFVDH